MNIEKWLKEAFEDYDPKPQGKCLADSDIACVLDQVLNRRQRLRMMKHLNSCAACAKLLKQHLYLSRAGEDKPLIQVPQHVVERAKAIVSGESRPDSIMDIVLNIGRDALRLVETTGTMRILRTPQPVFRGRKIETTHSIKVSKKLRRVAVEAVIQKTGPDKVDILIKAVVKKRRKDSEELQISLFQGSRELHSMPAVKGMGRFEDVKAGGYRIEIREEGRLISTLRIKVRQKP